MARDLILFQRLSGRISQGQIATGTPVAGYVPMAISGSASDIPAWTSPGGGGSGATLVASLTNKSGASVALGDVVILDSTNDDSFTTTTSAASMRKIGIAAATIANNAAGNVVIAGYVGLVNVNGTPSRGDFLFTSTTAKKADGSGSFAAGAFGVVSKAGGTPTAVIFLHTDQGGGGGGGLTPLYTDGGTGGIRLPDDLSYTRFEQGDPGDGSDAYLDMQFGDAQLFGTDGSQFPSLKLNGSSNGNAILSADGTGSVVLNAPTAGRHSLSGGKGVLFPTLSADPSSPSAGQVYYNTTTHKLKCYDGTSWNDLF